jgi:hypothetical protein
MFLGRSLEILAVVMNREGPVARKCFSREGCFAEAPGR